MAANARSRLMLLLLNVLLLCAAAARIASEEEDVGCGLPGDTQCDDSERILSICLESGDWHRAVDCSRHGRVCRKDSCWLPAVAEAADPRATSKCSDQDVGQLKCSEDCTTLGLCVNTTNWLEIERCESGKACYKDECVPVEEGQCEGPDHILCTANGAFPSLKDCTKYYICSENSARNCQGGGCQRSFSSLYKWCDAGLQFNECSGKCDLYYGGSCLNNYGQCELGQTLTAKGNPSLYYVCLPDSVQWRKCENGNYNPDAKQCSGTNACTSLPKPTVSTTTTDSVDDCDFTPPKPCTGPTEIPNNNCFYYKCTNGKPDKIQCPQNTHYDPEQKRCVSGECKSVCNH